MNGVIVSEPNAPFLKKWFFLGYNDFEVSQTINFRKNIVFLGSQVGMELVPKTIFPLGKVPKPAARRAKDIFAELGQVGGKKTQFALTN